MSTHRYIHRHTRKQEQESVPFLPLSSRCPYPAPHRSPCVGLRDSLMATCVMVHQALGKTKVEAVPGWDKMHGVSVQILHMGLLERLPSSQLPYTSVRSQYAVAPRRPVCLIEGIHLHRYSQHSLGVYQPAAVRALPHWGS